MGSTWKVLVPAGSQTALISSVPTLSLRPTFRLRLPRTSLAALGLKASSRHVFAAADSSMQMATLTESYSLWLMPSGLLAERLQREIDELAARVPDAPRFAPHVTLLGGVEKPLEAVLCATEQLAAELRPYRISFDRVSSGAIFHQCVYILCKTEGAAMAAGAAARRAFGQDPSDTYMPHLSLIYSDIGQQERHELAAQLQGQLFEGDGALAEGGFEVGSIAVWRTPVEDKSLQSWGLVKVIPLQR